MVPASGQHLKTYVSWDGETSLTAQFSSKQSEKSANKLDRANT